MGFFTYMGEILWVFLTFIGSFPNPSPFKGEVRRGMGYIMSL